LEDAPAPEELDYLLAWFRELEWGRRWGAHGHPEAMGWTDIQAWAALTDRCLRPYEVEALMMIDAAARNPGEAEKDDDA